MSVYYEALKRGWLLAGTPAFSTDGRMQNKGIARALREAKRYEAEERNARTPYERTKRYRKETAA